MENVIEQPDSDVSPEAVNPEPWKFKKGHDPRRHDPALAGAGKKKRGPTTPATPLPEDGAPQALQDARWVYLNDEGHDSTQAHKHMREFLTKQPSAFMSQMTAMESEHRDRMEARQKEAGNMEDKAEDVGSARALALCEAWLAEQGEKRGGREERS